MGSEGSAAVQPTKLAYEKKWGSVIIMLVIVFAQGKKRSTAILTSGQTKSGDGDDVGVGVGEGVMVVGAMEEDGVEVKGMENIVV